jgi:hypothetical protein
LGLLQVCAGHRADVAKHGDAEKQPTGVEELDFMRGKFPRMNDRVDEGTVVNALWRNDESLF